MTEHDPKRYEQATTIATAIRSRKKNIAGDFLWIGEHALLLKEEKLWQVVAERWADFCEDPDAGLGMASSSVRSLIDVFLMFIENGIMTKEEAEQAGWHKLQISKAVVKKIPVADRKKAKDILLSTTRMADMKDALRELVPEKDRKPLDRCNEVRKAFNRAWEKLNELSPEEIDEDFKVEIQDVLAKVNGYLLR